MRRVLTFDRGARPDAQCPSQVIGELRVVVGIIDGEYAIHDDLAVEVPLCVLVYHTYLSSLRSARAIAAEKHRQGEERS